MNKHTNLKKIAELAMATGTKQETLEKLENIGRSDEELSEFLLYCYWYGSAGACIERSVKAGNVKVIHC